jgi:hypothetical protein
VPFATLFALVDFLVVIMAQRATAKLFHSNSAVAFALIFVPNGLFAILKQMPTLTTLKHHILPPAVGRNP